MTLQFGIRPRFTSSSYPNSIHDQLCRLLAVSRLEPNKMLKMYTNVNVKRCKIRDTCSWKCLSPNENDNLLFVCDNKLIFYRFYHLKQKNQLPSHTLWPICVHHNFYDSHAKCMILYKIIHRCLIQSIVQSDNIVSFMPLFAFTFLIATPHQQSVQRCTIRKIQHNDRHRDTIAGQSARVILFV